MTPPRAGEFRASIGAGRFALWTAALAAVVLGAACASGPNGGTTPSLQGPVPYRCMMPLSLIFPHPPPDKASVLPKGRTEVAWNSQYASVLVKETKQGDSIDVDGEFLRTALFIRSGIAEGVEAAVELPFLHYSSGFMDEAIKHFHDAFGLPQGKRDKVADDQYSARYASSGRVFFSPREDGFHLGDIPLYLKVGLLDPDADKGGLGLAARGVLELPTGDEDKGFGSGQVDGGAGLLFQQYLAPDWAVYASADYVFRKNPEGFHDLHVANAAHGSLSLEKVFAGDLSLVMQTDYQTHPLEDSALREFRLQIWTASVGVGWWVAENARVRLLFTEGITTDTAADFILGLSVGYSW